MSKNRTSTHRGKSGSARHNEHRHYEKNSRDTTLHSFIHQKDNDAWNMTSDEMKFYERYQQQLNEQNAKYVQRRQYKRVKSLKDFYNSKRYKPTEELLQYGHFGGEVPDRDTYEKMTKEYARRKVEWSKKHGNHLHVLNYANHYDESTPHTHLREIWDYRDDEGILRVSQEEAMKHAGIELPDPSKPEGRYNNRSITYTKMCREMWQDICEEYGYEVERVPLENGRKKHETVAQYHARKGRELEAKEQELNERDTALTIEFLDVVGDVTGYEYDPELTTLEEVKKDLSDWRDGLVKREDEIRQRSIEAKKILADAKVTRSQATKNFKTAIKARNAYENLEDALQQYVDSIKDEMSLEDWARRQKRRDGRSLFDKYLDDTKAERERKQKAFSNIVGHKSRAEIAEERFGDILKQYDDDNDLSL